MGNIYHAFDVVSHFSPSGNQGYINNIFFVIMLLLRCAVNKTLWFPQCAFCVTLLILHALPRDHLSPRPNFPNREHVCQDLQLRGNGQSCRRATQEQDQYLILLCKEEQEKGCKSPTKLSPRRLVVYNTCFWPKCQMVLKRLQRPPCCSLRYPDYDEMLKWQSDLLLVPRGAGQ